MAEDGDFSPRFFPPVHAGNVDSHDTEGAPTLCAAKIWDLQVQRFPCDSAVRSNDSRVAIRNEVLAIHSTQLKRIDVGIGGQFPSATQRHIHQRLYSAPHP